MPDFRDYAVEVPKPGAVQAEATRVLGTFLRDVMKLNADSAQFPRDRARTKPASNRLDALFEVTNRVSDGPDPARPTTTSRPTAA